MSDVADIQYMQQAINLAKLGRFTTSPNPNVGCVIVKNNQVIGQGYHQKAGQGHAEVNALKQAGDNANGATAYVTLEPCSHYGRTPPCADGLITAGISRVVVAMMDPNPLVAGRGIEKLQCAGIQVDSGVLEQQANALNPGFIKRMQTNLPFVTVKLGVSLDGRTALENGVSQWITASDARVDVQQFRAQHCAILTGSGTVLKDNPSLNLRWQELGSVRDVINESQLRQPIRVVIDSHNQVLPSHKMIGIESPIILIRRQRDLLTWPSHVEQLMIDGDGQFDLYQVLELLAQRGINAIWVEAGAKLCGALLSQQLVDRLVIYQAPKIIGDLGKGLFHLPTVENMEQVIDLSIDDLRMVGRDIRVMATPTYLSKTQIT
ncbi:MAG: bifunctional diaminohydroxyphosphoribosylaminopyrimidine deaminase/5-amino-6-(5-phosphoribosylamino)uracil reductase RibD [Gammaproteobacteria bacterium]|nr:bifunctional diaminohydroxyphosphoribosylaminopyrimidine deaminase/5-amino-6-(5-phosphoribosylamino)uracil reductase RibD [Gammaproteobacteria bacterium]